MRQQRAAVALPARGLSVKNCSSASRTSLGDDAIENSTAPCSASRRRRRCKSLSAFFPAPRVHNSSGSEPGFSIARSNRSSVTAARPERRAAASSARCSGRSSTENAETRCRPPAPLWRASPEIAPARPRRNRDRAGASGPARPACRARAALARRPAGRSPVASANRPTSRRASPRLTPSRQTPTTRGCTRAGAWRASCKAKPGSRKALGSSERRREVAPGVVIVVKLFDAQRPHPKSVS